MQLKSKSPSLFSRRLGMSFVFAGLIGFGYMAWAAQPAKIKLVNPVQAPASEVNQRPTQHLESLTSPVDTAVMTSSATPLHRETAKRATIESAELLAANDAQRTAKEQAPQAQAAAERARSEAHAHARADRERMAADQERMAADQERMHADSIRRAEVEAEAQARATQARAESDRARMEAEQRERAAFDEATQAEAARARSEAESRAASDSAAAAKAASARQAHAQLDAKYDMLRRSRTLTKQLRGQMAVEAAERNVKSR